VITAKSADKKIIDAKKCESHYNLKINILFYFDLFVSGCRPFEPSQTQPVRRRFASPRGRLTQTTQRPRGRTLPARTADLAVGEAVQGGRVRDPGGRQAAARVPGRQPDLTVVAEFSAFTGLQSR